MDSCSKMEKPKRVKKEYHLQPYQNEGVTEIGIDEAGAGTFFGSLFVAGVILPQDIEEKMKNVPKLVIRDSKKMSQKKREEAEKFIKENALTWNIVEISNTDVDEMNILQARLYGFHEVIRKSNIKPQKILIDGDKFKPYIDDESGEEIPHECVIEGDNTYLSIAAASILAKTAQMRHIEELVKENEDFKKYDIQNNHGYGTQRHLYGIEEFGVTPYHRLSFGICRKYSNGRFEEKEKKQKKEDIKKYLFTSTEDSD